jgi:hypothetical protein
MKIAARGSVACVMLLTMLALESIATTSSAQTPSRSLNDQLVGHWQLVSVSVNGNDSYGASPQGSMFFDAGGHYSVIVISAARARNVSYFGTYTVNDADNSIAMHIDASNQAGAAGRDDKRYVTFSGDELIVANQKAAGPLGSVKLIWKSVN